MVTISVSRNAGEEKSLKFHAQRSQEGDWTCAMCKALESFPEKFLIWEGLQKKEVRIMQAGASWGGLVKSPKGAQLPLNLSNITVV